MPKVDAFDGIKMRKLRIPRIIKINWIKELAISVVFNNGESRITELLTSSNKNKYFHGLCRKQEKR